MTGIIEVCCQSELMYDSNSRRMLNPVCAVDVASHTCVAFSALNCGALFAKGNCDVDASLDTNCTMM